MRYEDIGHSGDKDTRWIIIDNHLYALSGGRTFEMFWGDTPEVDYWHGRYDHLSWKCSIVPSEECRELTEPPDSLIEKLSASFQPVSAFYYYGHNKEDVEPMEFSDAE